MSKVCHFKFKDGGKKFSGMSLLVQQKETSNFSTMLASAIAMPKAWKQMYCLVTFTHTLDYPHSI